MTVPFLQVPLFTWPAAPGGKLHTYAAGGTTPKTTWSDAAGTVPNSNPVTLDSTGSATVRGNGAYHFVLKDWTDTNTLWDADNYSILDSSQITYDQTPAELAAGVTPVNYAYAALNVFRYGATGNGSTDDTTAINNAILVARIYGGVVFLPAGTYKISSTLAIGAYSNVYVLGAGAGLTTITPTAAVSGYALTFLGATANQGFSNLTISAGLLGASGVEVNSVEGFIAQNFVLQGCATALAVVGGNTIFCSNWAMNTNGNIGIQITGGSDLFFSDGLMSNVGFSQPISGVNISNGSGIYFTDVDLIEQGTGLYINPAGSQSVYWCSFQNLLCDTCSNDGIDINPTSTGTVYGLNFSTCWSSSSTNHGFYINAPSTASVNGIRVIGHRSLNNGKNGYLVSSQYCTNTFFDSCDASGNSQSSPNSYPGFEFGVNVSGFSVTNSKSGNEDNFSGTTQSYGILVDAGTSNNYVITGNNVTGNFTSGISDSGTGSIKNVTGNIGYNPFGLGSISPSGSPFTYSNDYGAPIAVSITGGTVSSVTVNGYQVASATNTTVVLPHGISMVVTYTGTPTMNYYGIS